MTKTQLKVAITVWYVLRLKKQFREFYLDIAWIDIQKCMNA